MKALFPFSISFAGSTFRQLSLQHLELFSAWIPRISRYRHWLRHCPDIEKEIDASRKDRNRNEYSPAYNYIHLFCYSSLIIFTRNTNIGDFKFPFAPSSLDELLDYFSLPGIYAYLSHPVLPVSRSFRSNIYLRFTSVRPFVQEPIRLTSRCTRESQASSPVASLIQRDLFACSLTGNSPVEFSAHFWL